LTKYQENLLERRFRTEAKERIIFGLIGGLLLMGLGLTGILNHQGWVKVLAQTSIYIGGLFFLLGIFYPPWLAIPKNAFFSFGNGIGKAILSTILLVFVYTIFILPVGLVMQKKKGKYQFERWKDALDSSHQTALSPRGNQESVNKKTSNRYVLLRVFSYFIRKKHFIMIPVLCILLILALLFFFISTTIIAPFVYTIF